MEKSLDKTYGIIVYQEQVMQLVRDIAGFSLGQADILRRAMGKKKQSLMDAQKPVFIEGAKENGIDEKLANEIFDLIVKFAEYGFNKSHSLAYSYLAYQTAWLKANYTAEFLAANMTAELNSQKKIVQLIDEAKKFNIEVLPPDVNRSLGNFTVEGDKIFFGMAGIKNIGMPVVDSIVKARQEGNFISFFDFVARVDPEYINHRSLEALVCAGAFDSIEDGRRAALYEVIDSAIEYARAVHNDDSDDNDNLFGGHEAVQLKEPELPKVKEWSGGKKLAKEREYLNFYISGHPLHSRYPHVNKFSTIKFNEIESKLIGQNVMVCGIISEIDIKRNKKDQNFAIITFEDLTGKGECILWNKTYSEYQDILEKDGIFVFEGKSELNSDMLRILVEKVTPIEKAVIKYAKGYRIMLPRNDDSTEKLRRMRNEYCVDKKSKTKVLFQIYGSNRDDLRSYISYDVNIPLNDEYSMKLLKLFGGKNVSFLTD